MTPRLGRDEVTHHVGTLRERSSLTALQAARLDAIVGTLGDDGRFRLRDALVAAEFPDGDARGQEAFQDFRKRINAAAADAGVDLQLELDSRKARPDDRYGWFTGGDLVDEDIASFTTAAAGRTGITHPVGPEVTELGPGARIRVYVGAEPGRCTDAVLKQLREALALDRDRRWIVADSGSANIGEDPDALRDQVSARADIRVALINPSYLAGDERRRVLDQPGPTVAFAVSGIPDTPLDLGRLGRHDVHRRDSPWDELTRTAQRRRYVNEIVDALRRELERPVPAVRTADEPLEAWTSARAWHKRAGESAVAVSQDAAEASLRESRLDGVATTSGPALPAVDRLVDWATGDGPPLCALLGDVGMGKTTTAKLFTQHMLELRGQDAGYPLPLLFDLRDVRIAGLAASMTLDSILNGVLDATRPPNVPSSRLDATAVRSRLARGDAVVVFDGLDEVLVHLSPHDQKLFTRQLWRAAEGGARMLVTCRTQYFRTIRDEIGCFTGEDRQGLRGEHYLALLMQPFREEQVREYLQSNVERDGDWVDGFLETVAAVHDLTDLSHRPLTLRLIADQVEFIETAKLAGRPVRSVDLYGEFVDRWLSRDAGKHTLTPEQKRLLMEEIAAGLWRSGRSSWAADEVDDWLLELLERRPHLQRHYRQRVPDLWKADFRTATFLSRDREKDTFEFGHRSLLEYFLARYLLRALTELGSSSESDAATIVMPTPSQETLEFLGQSIAGTSHTARETVLGGLARIRDRYTAHASELALAYAVHAVANGHPRHELDGIRLGGAALNRLKMNGSRSAPLSMTRADLAGADLRRAVLRDVDLTGADLAGSDLSHAELHRCRLDSAHTTSARMTGTVLRRCWLSDVRLDDVVAYRTQVLFCTPAPPASDGLLVAPSQAAPEVDGPLRVLTGHNGSVRAGGWSPDDARILTAGYGGARIWDAATDQILAALDAHGRTVAAAAWSPDGTQIVTGGEDGVRVWDAATLTVRWHNAIGPDHVVNAVAWSSDGTQILTGGRVEFRIVDASSGRVLHRHIEAVNSVACASDGSGQVTAGGRGLQLRDNTGEVLVDVTDGPVSSVAWSPDGTQILTGDPTGAVLLRDATTGARLREVGHAIRDEDGDGPEDYRAGDVTAVAWSPAGTRVIIGSRNGTVRLDDAAEAGDSRILAGMIGRVHAIAWPSAGHRAMIASDAGTMFWSQRSLSVERQVSAQGLSVASLAWSPDGKRLLTHQGNGDVRGLDLTNGATLLLRHTASGYLFAWSPDATRTASVDDDDVLRVCDAETGKVLVHADVPADNAGVAWSPNGTRIIVGGPNGLLLVDSDTGELERPLPDIGRVQHGAWSPDSMRILTATPDGIQIVDAETSNVLGNLVDSGRLVGYTAWSPDSSRILTGGYDGTVRIWDAESQAEIFQVERHCGTIHSVAWSGNGRYIASGGDGCVRVHDADSGALVHHITGHTDWVSALAWSGDSTRLASGGFDGTIQVVDAATGRPTGFRFAMLPRRQMAVFDAVSGDLVGAGPGAWRWLGWNATLDGLITRLPAETFGPLPPLPGTARRGMGSTSPDPSAASQ